MKHLDDPLTACQICQNRQTVAVIAGHTLLAVLADLADVFALVLNRQLTVLTALKERTGATPVDAIVGLTSYSRL